MRQFLQKTWILIIMGALFFSSFAQENNEDNEKSGPERKFLLSGYSGLTTKFDAETYDEVSFGLKWKPVMLWQATDRLFFEGSLEMEVEAATASGDGHGGHAHGGNGHGSSGEIPLGGLAPSITPHYANLVYIAHDYLTITAGQFWAPFGTFMERLHPAWINKLPNSPLGLGHHSPLGPTTEIGVQARGALPLGAMKMNYAFYVSNGPVLNITGESAGQLKFTNFLDNNQNKAIGGRFGWLPLSNSSLEIGVSAQQARVGPTGTQYQDVEALMYGADLSYFKSLSALAGDIDLRAQWNHINVDKAIYYRDRETLVDNPGLDSAYTFNNKTDAFYAQLSYRPSKLNSEFIKNLEGVFRYGVADRPKGALWEKDNTRYSIGLDYWFHARSVLKLSYQVSDYGNLLYAQFIIGY